VSSLLARPDGRYLDVVLVIEQSRLTRDTRQRTLRLGLTLPVKGGLNGAAVRETVAGGVRSLSASLPLMGGASSGSPGSFGALVTDADGKRFMAVISRTRPSTRPQVVVRAQGHRISLTSAPEDLQERLYDEHRIEILVSAHRGERFIRASFQGYNDAGDLDRLRDALAALL
jgi:hypothetical protein